MSRPSVPLALAALAAASALAACSDATSAGRHAVSLSFANSGAASASVATASTASSTSPLASVGGALVVANELVITRAQVVLSRTELVRQGAVCSDDDDSRSHDDDCGELELGPMLVDLPLTPTPITALTASVPAGTYTKLEAKIDALTSDELRRRGVQAFLAAHPEFQGVSVRVEGTYNGTPFVWTGDVEAGLELSFDPPLVVGDGASNVTVQVDLSSWFRGANGVVIDPATARPGGANAERVRENIRRSFKAFDDDDHDGHDDHDDDHGDDGPGHG